MARDQIRHYVLLESVFAVQALKFATERVVDGAARLAHHREHRVAHVLGRYAELARNMMLQQLTQKLVRGVGHGVVKADAAADEDLFDARQLAQVAQQLCVAALVDHHVLAHARPQAALVLAHAVFELLVAGRAAKVCRRSAHVVDVALKLGIAREQLGLAHDRVVAAHLQHAALVEGERAKRALAKTAAVGANGKLDLGKGRHAARRVVVGMPVTCIGEFGHLVHLVGGERRRRRVLHHVHAVGIWLYQAMPGDGVHILLLHVKAACVVELVGGKVVPAGQ